MPFPLMFSNYRPRTVWLGDVKRVRIGEPEWKYLGIEAAIALTADLSLDV